PRAVEHGTKIDRPGAAVAISGLGIDDLRALDDAYMRGTACDALAKRRPLHNRTVQPSSRQVDYPHLSSPELPHQVSPGERKKHRTDVGIVPPTLNRFRGREEGRVRGGKICPPAKSWRPLLSHRGAGNRLLRGYQLFLRILSSV